MMNKKEYIEALDNVKMSDELKEKITAQAGAQSRKKKNRKHIAAGVVCAAAAVLAVVILPSVIPRLSSKSFDTQNSFADGLAAPAEKHDSAKTDSSASEENFPEEAEQPSLPQDIVLLTEGENAGSSVICLGSAEEYKSFADSHPGFFSADADENENFFTGLDLLAIKIIEDENSRFSIKGVTASADKGKAVFNVQVLRVSKGEGGRLAEHLLALSVPKQPSGEPEYTVTIIN